MIPLNKKPRIDAGFSNGTEYMSWHDGNCQSCARCNDEALVIAYEDAMPMIEAGIHCEYEPHVSHSACDGTINERVATILGWGDNPPSQCSLFRPRGKGGDDPPKPRIPIAPNQLVMNFEREPEMIIQ